MGLEEKLPSGILLTSVEKLAGYARKSSVWPATFGLACCAIELMATGGPRHDLARFGMEKMAATPRQADLMIVAGRVSQKMAPVLRQVYDQMAEPKWVISMGVCASSGGMFNNYAIVQGVDHVVPVDIYLPGCPPRPEMLLDAIVKLHDKIQNMKLAANREAEIEELDQARRRPRPPHPGGCPGTRRAGGPAAGRAVRPPPLRFVLRRDRRPAGGTPGGGELGLLHRGGAGDRGARRTRPARAARAPGGGRHAAARRSLAGLRDVPGRQRSALPLGLRPGTACGLPAVVHQAQPAAAAGSDRGGRPSPHSLPRARLTHLRLAPPSTP